MQPLGHAKLARAGREGPRDAPGGGAGRRAAPAMAARGEGWGEQAEGRFFSFQPQEKTMRQAGRASSILCWVRTVTKTPKLQRRHRRINQEGAAPKSTPPRATT